MPEYSELSELIGEFKRAAIDAYMRTQTYAFTIRGDQYEINSSGAHYKVSRPGPDGQGGGDWTTDNFIAELFTGGSQDEKWGEAFDSIRSRIDAAIEPWLSLPDPADIETFVDKCRTITGRLSGAAAVNGDSVTGSGLIPGNLALILANTTAMSGSAIAAFKSNFLLQLGSAIGGHHAISLVLGSALASEKGLWESARRSVAGVVAGAKDAAQGVADTGSTGQGKAVLEVVGWALKGAKTFLPDAAVELPTLAIEILSGDAGAPPTREITAADAEGVLSSFESALSALNDDIRAEETTLQENLTKNLANIRADRSSYDLTVPGFRDDPADAGDVIIIEPSLVEEITSTYLPKVADELTEVSNATLGATMTAVSRDGSLGVGASGPSAEWGELRWLLHDLLSNLAWDVTQGATNLDLVLQDMRSNEQRIADEITALLARLDAGAPTDPWS